VSESVHSGNILHLQDLFMLLLDAMEAHFGSVETWLSCIISYLFAGQPQPRLGHFKELWAVVAFFYGNGVLCSLG